MAEIPDRETERLYRKATLTNARLDATHPPTGHRIRFIESLDIPEPLYQMTDEMHRRLVDEMSKLFQPLETEILDRYRSYLYHTYVY